jgi:hypothetical protein
MNGSNQLVQKLWNFCNVLRLRTGEDPARAAFAEEHDGH